MCPRLVVPALLTDQPAGKVMQRNQTAHFKPLSRRQMRGFSICSLSLSLLLGGLLMLALRIMPVYAEYLTVRDVIVRAAAQHDSETQPLADLSVRTAKLLKANQVDDTSIDDLVIKTKSKGRT